MYGNANRSYLSFCDFTPPNGEYARENSIGVRPVITLQVEIKTSNGDGSKANPYELVEKYY